MRYVRPMSFFPTPKMSLTFCLFWLYFGSSLLTFTPLCSLCLPSRVTNEKLCLMSIIHNREQKGGFGKGGILPLTYIIHLPTRSVSLANEIGSFSWQTTEWMSHMGQQKIFTVYRVVSKYTELSDKSHYNLCECVTILCWWESRLPETK